MILNEQSKELVLRLSKYFEAENQNGGSLIPVTKVRDRIKAALGISGPTVTKILKQAYNNGTESEEGNNVRVPSPQRKRRRRKPCPITRIDNFDADAIRRHIYGFFERKEYPTLRKLTESLRQSELFFGQKSSLSKILKKIGFRFKKCDKRKVLMERTDIALARCDFLRKAKKIEDWTNVVFTDETWLNANHTQSKCWTDDTAASSSFTPIGKGERLIICHAGTAKGFISNALLAFKSKKTGDYHEEMNASVYEEWFKDMLTSLEEPSIIFIDNAPYHSRQINKMPTQASKKAEIIQWLRNNGENVNESMLKVELLKILKTKTQPKQYVIDEMAAEHGHTVIRIPPYHCHYNAIELIWAQVKGHAARHNTTPPFTAKKMLCLLKNACDSVTEENWANVVRKTKEKIMSDWDRDIVVDNFCDQQLIIHLSEDSSDSSMSEEEHDSC